MKHAEQKTGRGTAGPSLRERLVQRSIKILETNGIHALTLRSAARAAGVSHMAPYRHFANKDALLAAVAETGFRDLATELDHAATGECESLKRLRAVGRAYLGFAERRPALYRLMFGSHFKGKERFPDLVEAAAAAYARCAEAVAAAHGTSGSKGLNPEALTIATWSLVHGLAHLLIDGKIAEPGNAEAEERLIEQIFDVHAKAFD